MTAEGLPAARTRTESLRLQLENDILSGRLEPGRKLDEEALAARYGMSRTPVREAIKALSSSGLIEVRQHQGAHVATLTADALGEMMEVMGVLETACAELAARRHRPADRSALLAAQSDCEEAVKAVAPCAFYEANVRFHEAVYDAAHNAFLARQARALRIRLEPYRRHVSHDRRLLKQSLQEHAAVVEAILGTKPAQAREAMREHIAALADDIAALAARLAG